MRYGISLLVLMVLGWGSLSGADAQTSPPSEGKNFADFILQKMEEGEFVKVLELVDQSLFGADAAKPAMNEKWTEAKAFDALPLVLSTRIQALNRLNRSREIDDFLEKFISVYATSWRALCAAADSYRSFIPHQGRVVAGQFFRGNSPRSGAFASVQERDRIRSLQLLVQCLPLIQKETDSIDVGKFYLEFAQALLQARNGQTSSWELQALTDFETLPEANTENPYGFSRDRRTEGTPLKEDGTPVTFALPESFESAKCDGERWRWALEQAVNVNRGKTASFAELDPALWESEGSKPAAQRVDSSAQFPETFNLEEIFRGEILNQIAGFYWKQFGVQTLNSFWYRIDEDARERMTREGSLLALETLADSETIAQTATGILRFPLPEEANFIKIYQELTTFPNRYRKSAALQLAQIAKNRRQYPRAVKLFESAAAIPICVFPERLGSPIGIANPTHEIQQITGNWARFETQTQQTSDDPKLRIRFRNATQAAFTATRIDVEKLLAELKDAIRKEAAKGPMQPNQFQRNFNSFSAQSVVAEFLSGQKNVSQFLTNEKTSWEQALEPAPNHHDSTTSVPLKVAGPGVYLVEMVAKDGNQTFTIAGVFDAMIVSKMLDGARWYYVADARTGKAIPGAKLNFTGWHQEWLENSNRRRTQVRINSKELSTVCDENGSWVAKPQELPENFQYFVSASTPDSERIAAFFGFDSGWFGFNSYTSSNYDNLTAFGITDRPVYRPEQPVHFKFWLSRAAYGEENYFQANPENEDAPRFQPVSPQVRDEFEVGFIKNRKVQVQILDPNGEKIHEFETQTDEFGAVSGNFPLPKDAKLGQYQIQLVQSPHWYFGEVTFRMEEYRKPEFEVKIDAPKEPVLLGETMKVGISSKYYFGAPVANGTVHYRILRQTFSKTWYAPGPWDWLYGTGYWWCLCDYDWFPGWRSWGCAAPRPAWYGGWGSDEELVQEGEIQLTPEMEGKAEITLSTAAAASIYPDRDHQYRIEADVTDASRRTISGNGSVLAARKPFKINVWTRCGYLKVGDQATVFFAAKTLDGKPVSGSGTVKVFEISYEKDGTPNEKELHSSEIETSGDGTAFFDLKADHPGQFRVACTLTSTGENPQTIEGAALLTIQGDGFTGSDLKFNDLELIPDKSDYQPGETVKLLINTNQPDATVILFERCVNGICSMPRIIRMKGKSQIVELPIRNCDQPNFFVEAVTTARCQAYAVTKEICVPPEKRILNLEVLPSKDRFLPGEKAEVTLKLTDRKGNPFVGETVVTVYDKSLEYVSGGSNIPNIYAHFWEWKRYHQPGTNSTTGFASGSMMKTNSELARWMEDLGGFNTSLVADFSMLERKDSSLRFSTFGAKQKRGAESNRALAAKSRRSESLLAEDEMVEMDAAPMAMEAAAAPMPAAAPMGNLKATEKMDSSMVLADGLGAAGGLGADGADKKPGGAAPKLVEAIVRKNFADLAYWTASLKTNEKGEAKIEFPMPENLTTWKVMAWAMADGTRVGKAETEVITAKNLILRMQTPRFLTTSDELILTANVHNYLTTEKSVVVTLSLPEGAPCRLLDPAKKTVQVTIPAQGESRVDWWIRAEEEGKCQVTMTAQTDEESDAMQLTVPVQIHGMAKQDARSGMISANAGTPDAAKGPASADPQPQTEPQSKTEPLPVASGFMEFTIPEARRPKDSALEIRFSPTLAGAMLDAIPYLVEYPYGCTEQTTSRFVPAVLVRKALNDAGVRLSEIATGTNNLNAQEIGDARERNAQWKNQIRSRKNDPVFDEATLNDMVSVGVDRLLSMQCQDGGWGWFSGAGETSSPHLTSIVTRGLLLAQQTEIFGELEDPSAVAAAIESGLNWLERYQQKELQKLELYEELEALREAGKLPQNGDLPPRFKGKELKSRVDEIDVMVWSALSQAGRFDGSSAAMADFIFRDRVKLSPQSNALAGIAFFQRGEKERFQTILAYLTQFLKTDDENQTAWLSLPGFCYWWCWYGNDVETQAAYLRLLCLEPNEENFQRAACLVKYLLNQRKHATYWNSTRDTACVLEAFTQYLRTTNELSPQMTVEVLLDGELRKTVEMTPENLFTCDTTFLLEGEAVTAGTHRVELRRTGNGPLYFNGYARYFTLEDFIPKTGLEVKVDRKYYRLQRVEASQNAAGAHGQLVKQDVVRYERVPMKVGDSVTSGDLIEVELFVESKNDYSYILIEDPKPAGFEPVEVRSGYDGNPMGAYVEYRDDRVAFFVRELRQGPHSVSYRMQAETPGRVSALPTRMNAMYAPELKANSDEMKINCVDKP